MKLGLNTGYWSAGPPAGVTEQIAAADRLGFDSIWTAEAYGSDCFTPLAWWGAATERVRLGTSITQMSARTPAATAMAAMSLDHLSGGRFVLGVGASGPQVVEGWYGRPYSRPLARTREYVDIVRQVVGRAGPVAHDGEFYQLPYTGEGSTGLGKALKSTVHPLRRDIPISWARRGRRTSPSQPRSATGGWPGCSPPATTPCTAASWPRASAGPALGEAPTTSRWWRPRFWSPATTSTHARTSCGR